MDSSLTQKQRIDLFNFFKKIDFRFDESSENALHIGDNYKADYKGAKAVGIKGLLIDRNNHYSCKKELEKDRITSLGEVLELFENAK